MLRLILAIAGGAALAVLWPISAIAGGAAAGLLLGGAFVLGEEHSTSERIGFLSIYAAAMAAGVFVTQTLAPAIEVALVETVFAGATWGLFLAFAGGLRRLEWRRDEVLTQFRNAEADLEGELARTATSGRVLYEQITQELERAPQKDRERARDIARETSQALIALCRRSSELQAASERTSRRKLQMRVVQLDERIAATGDATVGRELQAALDELLEQVKVRQRLEVAHARLEARQQRCFTALERLHVALIQGGAGGSGDDAAVLESITSLEKLTDEIRWRNLSVDELCAGDHLDASDGDSDEMIASIRAELDAGAVEEAEMAAEQVILEEPEGEGTVLDTAAFADEVEGTDGAVGGVPGGTDGSLETESVAHVERQNVEHQG